ncbi:MAG: SpoIIIAH-like family protein [Ruminococcaceae bacterium]|nr:SpoIIIAH-like family protein [Oscillospiraceae bacterium]
MKFDELKEKAKNLLSKIGRKTIIVTASVVVIGIAVLLNFILLGDNDEKTGLKPSVDLSDLSTENSADKNNSDNAANVEEDYFATMTLSRQRAREEAMEVLQGVVDSEDAVEDMKTGAMEDIRRIADEIKTEANIESLIMSKGFEQCVAVVNGDTASIVVKSDGLLPNEISQISEIVYEQAGVLPSNLNIIEKS